ncbi:hypothetical protein [Rhodoferax ferrireducens]|uniref:hypothetical protein n=1 Tax=Rhodoferax ferrireducens TaxID=192843 RepID=UPI000E0DCCAE|nr:hypothetical protein [Rhodoferax ferrireducens]
MTKEVKTWFDRQKDHGMGSVQAKDEEITELRQVVARLRSSRENILSELRQLRRASIDAVELLRKGMAITAFEKHSITASLEAALSDPTTSPEETKYPPLPEAVCRPGTYIDKDDPFGAFTALQMREYRQAGQVDLLELVRAVHRAKGRYHSQLAMCNLYDACGLPNTRPEKAK